MHGFLLFILTPLLSHLTRLILNQGEISYLSYDNLGVILQEHPFVFLSLLLILLLLLLAVYFEFTFLLLTVFFIEQRQEITLRELLKGTLLQLRKIRIGTLFFFLFYFFLILPLIGMSFNSALLAKVRIPVFILDVIFEHKFLYLGLFILFYLLLIYLAVRFIFTLPEMILHDQPFKKAVKHSWKKTQRKLFPIIFQFLIVLGSLTLVMGLSQSLLLLIQHAIELYSPQASFVSAIIIMTLLQVLWVINIVLSTVSIFFITVDYMKLQNFLPEKLSWFSPNSSLKTSLKARRLKEAVTVLLILGVILFVGQSNADFLAHPSTSTPMAASHRGVDDKNGVQNSLEALKKTSQSTHPEYIEMDIQETKDHQFIVYHDYNLKALTGVNKKPNELTLAQLTKLQAHENGQTAHLVSFDDYLKEAQNLHQKLLIEIKPTKEDSPEMLKTFLQKYQTEILQEGHIIQSLSYDIIAELKELAPSVTAGYIMPFSVVGPPQGKMDFFTIEYTTLNSKFINEAHAQGKKVFTWTPNDADTMSRMKFYGADGIITDQMTLLNQTLKETIPLHYSDQLLFFVIGIG
ncbi:Glycerophosphoryl diester phosphodiesterase [Lactococcus cremoris]|nr:Glycerophosphoryl diester phosphodiesterase [Lactococcus cremoris]